MTPDHIIDACARAAHEANRAYSTVIGDSPYAWDDMTDAMREGVVSGARMALEGASPESLHVAWMPSRAAEGWVYGPVKDLAAKISPCFVPYSELPEAQRRKDAQFQAVVRAMAEALR